MTVQDDKTQEKTKADVAIDRPDSLGRRALIRGGVTAMPAILTLHSGAALARSSNLITASPAGTVSPSTGDTICLDTTSVVEMGDGSYDLGAPPYARATIIRDEIAYFQSKGGNDPIGPGPMCEKGGTIWSKANTGGWVSGDLKPGGRVVSFGAISSFAGYVDDSFF